MNANTQIIETKTKLLEVINGCNLPIVVVDLLLSELQSLVRAQVAPVLEREAKENSIQEKE